MENRLKFICDTSDRSGSGSIIAKYKCICGNFTYVEKSSIKSGNTKSCGCLGKEARLAFNTKHGMSKSKEYNSYMAMIQRCYNKNNIRFDRYGGRGISVCDRWLDSFDNFYADMGLKPTDKHTIDRIDNDGNYSHDNCRWLTVEDQNRNNSRCIKYNNMTAAQASITLGGNRNLVSKRIKLGWSIEAAFTLTKGSKKPN